jgi:hypothetical protein
LIYITLLEKCLGEDGLYETGNYEQVYGKSLGTLEKEWRVSLREN